MDTDGSLFLGNLNATAAELLAKIPPAARTEACTSLNLLGNCLGCEHGDVKDISALMACLRTQRLRSATLASAELNAAALSALLAGVDKSAPLTKLNLRFNPLGNAAIGVLTGRPCPSLQALTLTGCGITQLGSEELGRHFGDDWASNIRELNMSINPSLCFAPSNLSRLSRLARLNLSGCGVTTDALAALTVGLRRGSVTALQLSDNKITSDGFAALLPLAVGPDATLTSLVLSRNRIGNCGVMAMLKALSLSMAAPKTHHSDPSTGRSALRIPLQLSLEHNGITDLGLQALVLLIRQLTRFHALHLGGNAMFESTMKVLKETLRSAGMSVSATLEPLLLYGPSGTTFPKPTRRLVH